MPKLVGLSQEEAKRELERLNINEFKLSSTPHRENHGVVVQQYPRPGADLEAGQTVTLVLGVKPVTAEATRADSVSEPNEPIKTGKGGWKGWLLTFLITAWMVGLSRALWRAWRVQTPPPEVAYGDVRDLELRK